MAAVPITFCLKDLFDGFVLQTPCCDGLYRCRFCHDEEQDHTLRRDDVRTVECSTCGHRQVTLTVRLLAHSELSVYWSLRVYQFTRSVAGGEGRVREVRHQVRPVLLLRLQTVR